MPVKSILEGLKGDVFSFVRANGRCPARQFLNGIHASMRLRFQGSFQCFGKMGQSYVNDERFQPLADEGKPLWVYKEDSLRICCSRAPAGEKIRVVLFNGWEKSKGKKGQESREIAAAVNLFNESLEEGGGTR